MLPKIDQLKTEVLLGRQRPDDMEGTIKCTKVVEGRMAMIERRGMLLGENGSLSHSARIAS